MADPISSAGDGDSKENSVAKTAGLVVFSGVAMSILKALNPFNKNGNEETPPLSESTQPIQLASSQPQPLPPQQQPILKEPYPPLPVSIDAIKEANGLCWQEAYHSMNTFRLCRVGRTHFKKF